jgi:hypothetical protein
MAKTYSVDINGTFTAEVFVEIDDDTTEEEDTIEQMVYDLAEKQLTEKMAVDCKYLDNIELECLDHTEITD